MPLQLNRLEYIRTDSRTTWEADYTLVGPEWESEDPKEIAEKALPGAGFMQLKPFVHRQKSYEIRDKGFLIRVVDTIAPTPGG